MSKKNKHRNNQFAKHKNQQRAARVGAPAKRAVVDEVPAFKSPAEMRDELIRQRLMSAPKIPSVADMGLTPHENYTVHAKVQIFVYDENNDTHFSMVKLTELPWNDGPVALGLQLATLTGEMAKEVWGLNNNGSDKSKPTEEN